MFKSILQKLKLLCTAPSVWMVNFWEMKERRFDFFLRCRFWNIQNIIMTCLIEFSNKIIKTSKFKFTLKMNFWAKIGENWSKIGPTINLTQSISFPLSFSRLTLDHETSVKVNGHVYFRTPKIFKQSLILKISQKVEFLILMRS